MTILKRCLRVGFLIVAAASLCSEILAAQNPTIQYFYDALGRLTAVVDLNGNTAVYTYDAVGNLLSISRYPSTQVSILSFSPTSGPVGATVTITGTGFSATASQDSVTFNGTAAAISSATTTQLVTAVPAGATTGQITVTAPGGSATSLASFAVTTGSAGGVTITGFTPSIGLPDSSVTITGSGFDPAPANDAVRFNATYGLVTAASSTSLSVNVPEDSTSGRITVANSLSTAVSSGDFFVVPPPHVVSDVLVTQRTTIGANASLNFTTANKIGLLIFDGTSGQQISVLATDSAGVFGCGALQVSLLQLNGTTLAQSSVCFKSAFIDTLTLPATGTYTLEVVPGSGSTGTLGVTVYSVTNVTGSITPNGSGVAANIATPGQNAYFTFAGTAGHRMSVEVTVTSGSFTCAWPFGILNPDGSVLAQTTACINPGFMEPVTLPNTGTYTVFFNPLGANTGTVTINLYDDVNDTGSITPNGAGVAATIAEPGENAYLTFAGTASHRMSVAVTFTGGSFNCGKWVFGILNPDGSVLAESTGCFSPGFQAPVSLPSTGTYTVFFSPQDTGTGTVTINVYDDVDVTGTITPNGSSVSATISEPGENAYFTFTGTSGHHMSVSVTVTSGSFNCGYPFGILNPNGSVLAQGNGCFSSGSLGPVALPADGTYTVYFYPPSTNTGTVTISLTDAGTIPPTNLAAPPGGQAQVAPPWGRR